MDNTMCVQHRIFLSFCFCIKKVLHALGRAAVTHFIFVLHFKRNQTYDWSD